MVMVRRIIWYGLVGASGVVVNLGVLTLAHWAFAAFKTFDSLVAVEASIVPNYLLNAHFTFQHRISWKGFSQYNLVMAVAEIIQVAVARYLIARGLDYRLAQIIAIPFGTGFGFLFSLIWVFRRRGAAHESDLQRTNSDPRPQGSEGHS